MNELEKVISDFISGNNTEKCNAFFLGYIETDDAWMACIDICRSSSNDSVKFFAANMIHTKVRRHWSRLTEGDRVALLEFLISVISTGTTQAATFSSEKKVYINRIILSLCCVCARTPLGMQQFIRRALEIIAFERLHAIPNSIGFEMLALWPGEVESLDISRTLRIDLEKDVLELVPLVLSCAESVLCTPENRILDHCAISAVRSFIKCGGLTLSGIFEDHRGILPGACQMLQSCDGWRVKQSCGFLQELAEVSEFPRPRSRDSALAYIQESICRSSVLLSQFFNNNAGGCEDVALDISNCVSTLVTKDAPFFASPLGFSVEFISFLLGCTRQRPRKMAVVTFDAWLSVQDVPTNDRHELAKRDVFGQLLQNILVQVMYPSSFSSWDDGAAADDDEDDFNSFRDLRVGSIQEVITATYYSLREMFFSILSDKMKEALSHDIALSWNLIEAVLFLVQAAMEAIKETINGRDDLRPSALDFIYNILSFLLSLPQRSSSSQINPIIASSTSKFIGSTTFLLTAGYITPASSAAAAAQSSGGAIAIAAAADPFAKLYLPSLEFLFLVLFSDRNELRQSAAKSIHQLCVRGTKLLTKEVVEHMIAKTVEMYSGSAVDLCQDDSASPASAAAAAPLMMITESIVRSIVAIDIRPLEAKTLINALSLPVIQTIINELQKPIPDHRHLGALLSICSQIIRFCDVPVPKGGGEAGGHILTDFISSLWPQLQLLEEHPTLGRSSVIRQSIFNIYSRCLLSAEDVVINHVGVIAEKNAIIVSRAVREIAAAAVVVYANHSIDAASGGAGSVTAALQCGKTVVEVISSQKYAGDRSYSTVLLGQLDTITWAMYEVLQRYFSGAETAAALRGSFDPESIEHYFSYVYSHMLFCPAILPQSQSLPQLLESVGLVLAMYSEREVVRVVLQVVQGLFVPMSQQAAACQDVLVRASYVHGASIVDYIFRVLDSSASQTLGPILGDTLYAIISGSEDVPGSLIKEWVSSPLRDQNRHQRIPIELREIVFNAIFRLSSDNKRRFKSLIQDIGKVSSGELTADDLLVYET